MPVTPSPWLSPDQFSQACAALPLVSLDFCLTRPGAAGPELLLGLPASTLPRVRLMGAWDHFYLDSAFDPGVSTHYVNLAHWLDLSAAEGARP